MSESDRSDENINAEEDKTSPEKSEDIQQDSTSNVSEENEHTIDEENDVSEELDPEKEAEEIEKDIKTMANEFETEEDGIKEKSMIEQLIITGLFIFGIIFSIIFLIFDSFLSSIRSIFEPISYSLSVILILWILFLSYKKSRIAD